MNGQVASKAIIDPRLALYNALVKKGKRMEPIRTIDDSSDFIYAVGEILFFCQCIEHDIKSIYYGMRANMGDDEYEKSKKWTLGQTIDRLERLDNSDDKPFFSAGDYNLLRDLTEIRNYYAHRCYVDWVYEGPEGSGFYKASKRLINDHNRLLKLHQTIESVRIRFHQGS